MNQQKRSKRMLNTIIFSLFFKYTDIKQLEIAVEAKTQAGKPNIVSQSCLQN